MPHELVQPEGGFLSDLDRRIIEATQAGLPLDPKPYHRIAQTLGVEPALVQERFRRMLESGVIRRIGAVPNHYKLGYSANGMTVWDVLDNRIAALGPRVGELAFVSHCYHRPRHLPDWPYNLFAMVHGRSRDEVRKKAAEIEELLGDDCRNGEILFSTRILKKTGLRLRRGEERGERRWKTEVRTQKTEIRRKDGDDR
ncbi:MAG: Lrp/AsnC family transcriptional regulator [Pseudomonadota bacterium]|nr:Lrp/AsnC family transcriptional regulator [Pseudomonadota bacterium]